MPLTFSTVKSVADALGTGVLRATAWAMQFLGGYLERWRWLQARFPSAPSGTINALTDRIAAAWNQAQEAMAQQRIPTLGQLQTDPTHLVAGRIAYRVTVSGFGWKGEVGGRDAEKLFTYDHTIYTNESLSWQEVRDKVQEFVDQLVARSQANPGPDGKYTVETFAWSLDYATRSY